MSNSCRLFLSKMVLKFGCRDLINLICTHLENFRSTKLKIEKRQLGTITLEKLDTELRQHLAMENRLHPALFSSEAQHKVSILYLTTDDTRSNRICLQGGSALHLIVCHSN